MNQGRPPISPESVLPESILPDGIPQESSAGAGEGTYGILDTVRGAVDVCSVAAGDRSVDEWMGVLGEVSRALTVLTAARDAAVVRLAAIDETVTEDGVIGEKVNGLGTMCLDAAAMVSTATGTSARFGDELVEQAITRVVRVPALHEAMLEGVLDDYKARRLAGELSDVPPDLARAVVEALGGDLASTSGPALQRRARTILMSLCPDLLRERIRKARKGVGLRRWMGEPGTDSWGGSFPSERAATAWAAIDALARRYRLEGRYDTLEQARAYALMDLVDGNVTVETVLHLTVPRDALDTVPRDALDTVPRNALGETAREGGQDAPRCASHADVDDCGHVDARSGRASFSGRPSMPAPRGATAGDGVFVAVAGAHGRSLSWFPLRALPPPSRGLGAALRACHRWSGALLDPGGGLATQAYRPGDALKTFVRQRDGGCRFPGCSTGARQCDVDHVLAWPHGPTTASNLICLCRRHHRIKQRHRWRVRLFADGVVEWVDPSGRLHRTEPVDHLGATQVRFVDAGLADTGSRVDSAGGGSAASGDVSCSRLEGWLAVSVEHATAAASPARRASSTAGGRAGRSPNVVSSEELDELSRAVRAGTFATIDDAIGSRSAPVAEAPRSARVCRADHRFARRDHIVKVRWRHRDTGDPAAAVESPPF